MRGHFRDQGGLFSYISPKTRVPALHPLREIRELVRAVLKDLGPSFGKLYASEGRPSIPPEQLLSALLLQADSSNCRNQKYEAISGGFVAGGPGFEPGLTESDGVFGRSACPSWG
jgi:hypothetical protein